MAWPPRIEIAEGQNISRDPMFDVHRPTPTPYRGPEGYDPETHVYFAEEALRAKSEVVAEKILDETPGRDAGDDGDWEWAREVAEKAIGALLDAVPEVEELTA